MPDPRDRQLFDFRQPDDGIVPSRYQSQPSSPFDFSETLTPANGKYNYRTSTRRTGGSAGALIGVALAIQALSFLALAIRWVAFVLILFVGQLVAVVAVASDAKGKGAETAVWCLVALCFPFIGPIVYMTARE